METVTPARAPGRFYPDGAPSSTRGSFLNPNPGPPTVWYIGGRQPIAWNTTFSKIKIILYQRNPNGTDMASSYVPSADEQRQESFMWTVNDFGEDNSEPWALRGLDASGSENEIGGDFWSAMFYINEFDGPSGSGDDDTSTSSSSRTITRTRSTPLSGYSTSTPTSTLRSFTKSLTRSSTSEPTLVDSSSERIFSPSAGRWERGPGDLSEDAAVGLLMGITLAVIGLTLCLITMYFNRLQRKEAERPKLVPVNTSSDELMSGGAQGYTRVPGASPVEMEVSPTELEITPVEMEGTRVVAEMDARREVPRVEDLDELVVR